MKKKKVSPNLRKIKVLMLALTILLASAYLVYSARLPNIGGDNNEWGTILNEYLNVTFDTSGSIKNIVNNSIALWNITGSNIFLRDITGSLGLGTASPTERLTVIGNANISGYLNISGDFIVNKNFNVTANDGNVKVGGILDAANVRVLGSDAQVESNAFKIINFTTNYDARSDRYALGNFTTNYAAEYAASGYKKGNLSSDLSAGVASNIQTSTLTSDNIIANKNLYIIGNISNLNIAYLNVNGSLYPTFDDYFDIGNGSQRYRNANFSGKLAATTIEGSRVWINGKDVQASSDFNLGNISNYTQYTRSSDFNIGNISNYTEYQRSSTFNLGNISNYTQYTRSSDFNIGNI
ncbi:MAG: hypothetical protein AABX33_08325, partial [Nanoarchaeota archaeon]